MRGNGRQGFSGTRKGHARDFSDFARMTAHGLADIVGQIRRGIPCSYIRHNWTGVLKNYGEANAHYMETVSHPIPDPDWRAQQSRMHRMRKIEKAVQKVEARLERACGRPGINVQR